VRFKLDENMPEEIADLLRDRGHDATTVLQQELGGEDDAVLAAVVKSETRILATLDRDFADIRKFPPAEHSGLLVFRVARQDPEHLVPIWNHLLDVLARESVASQLWIVEETAIRRRQV
jgi:hypothetical protein